MNTDLRDLIAPCSDACRRLEAALQDHHDDDEHPAEEQFQKFMAVVRSQQHLQVLSRAEEHPSSLAAVVETVCQAFTTTVDQISSRLSVSPDLWNRAVNNLVEPYRIPVDAFAALAREYNLRFHTLRDALLGSHQLFLKRNLDTHVRFAKSSPGIRKKEGYTKSLEAAFDELRTKTSAHRSSLEGDEEINRYLRELQERMA